MRDCTYPVLDGDTYADAIVLALDRGRALQDCTDRLRVLRRAYESP